MQTYKVEKGPLRLGTGAVLRLAPEQAKPRMHRLKSVGDDLYEVTRGPVEFKTGEQFGYDGSLPKALLVWVSVDGVPGREIAGAKDQPVKADKPKAKAKA